jgi:hypothetical protein
VKSLRLDFNIRGSDVPFKLDEVKANTAPAKKSRSPSCLCTACRLPILFSLQKFYRQDVKPHPYHFPTSAIAQQEFLAVVEAEL